MNCKICGSTEFVTNDGITYCTECQSQIEGTQAEVAVEHPLGRDIGSSGPKKKPTQKKKETSDWITIECFNHILHMQVSSLIKLGASPKLKNTVLHIWSKYLQRCEIVFRTDYLAKNGAKPLLGSLFFKRDIRILYGDKQISKRKQKKSEESVEQLENPSTDEVLMSSTNDVDDSGAELSTNEDTSLNSEGNCSKVKFSSHARKILRKKRKKPCGSANNRVHNMTLAKTLSICYLGLLYTEDQLSLLDLIRLVYEEKVPYVNLQDKLPSTMRLQNPGDRCAFLTYIVPDASSILTTSRKIMHFLKLPEYKEPSVFLATTRLVKDLNLPNDLLPIIKNVLERYKEEIVHCTGINFKKHQPENIPTEYQALAFILVAMKMLFVLDDKFEIEHTKVMNKLNSLYPERRYFEWKEWKEHSAVKEFLFLCEKKSYSSINNLDKLSADIIISKYPINHLRDISTQEPDCGNPRDRAPVRHRIIKTLSDIVHIPSSNPSVPTSFPLSRAVKCFVEEWKTLPMFKETKEMDFTLLQKDFSSCSLSFNPLQFDEAKDELSYLLMTSLYLPDTSVKVGSEYYFPVTYYHEVIHTTSPYWFFNMYVGDCGFGTSEITSDWLDKLPSSFRWLLNFFSKYAYCNNIALYNEVIYIEKILFLRRKLVLHRTKNRIRNKINVDF